MLIEKPHWETLSELTAAIDEHTQLKGPSLSQVSKTISAYAEELLVIKDGNTIRLADSVRMLDQLSKNWRLTPSGRSRLYRSSKGPLKLGELSNSTKLAWTLTGESSATRYCTIAQGGPMKVVVSDLKLAESLLSLTPDSKEELLKAARRSDDRLSGMELLNGDSHERGVTIQKRDTTAGEPAGAERSKQGDDPCGRDRMVIHLVR
ncbi:MAG: hypothetical protein JNL58_29090 [Planctomyces sp.]|nr:hypothetical protein [Planctomyces sp.]